MSRTPRPTDAELAILKVLWRAGPCTVREVQDVLAKKKPTGYTTVLKLLQIMTEKGIVERDEQERAHVYRARRSKEETQGQLVADLLERAFEGSTQQLVLRALSTKKASPEELKDIRDLLKRLGGR